MDIGINKTIFPTLFGSPRHVTMWVYLLVLHVVRSVDAIGSADNRPTLTPVVRRRGESADGMGGSARDLAGLQVLPVVRRAKTANLYLDEASVALRTSGDKMKQNRSIVEESMHPDQTHSTNVTLVASEEQVRRENRSSTQAALQVNHVGKLVSVMRPPSSVGGVGRREVETTASQSNGETARFDRKLTQKVSVATAEAILPKRSHSSGFLIVSGGLVAICVGIMCYLNPGLRGRSQTTHQFPRRSSQAVAKQASAKHHQNKRDEQEASEFVNSVATFATTTLQDWKAHGLEGKVSLRAKSLMQKLSDAKPTEYLMVNHSENVKHVMEDCGAKVDIESLKKDIKEGKCQLLLMLDPQSKDDEPCLILVIRLIRLLMKAKTNQGVRTLIEEERQESGQEQHANKSMQIVAQVCLDEADMEVALQDCLDKKLNVTTEWQKRNLAITKINDPEIEVKECSNFKGLHTWYLVSDVEMRVKEDANSSELEAIGLPQGSQFKTRSQKSINRQINVHHFWGWAPLDKVQKKSLENALQAPTEQSDSWYANGNERFEATQSWIRQSLAKWHAEKQEIPQQVRAALKLFLAQTMAEYDAINSGSNVKELFSSVGIKMECEVLASEIKDQRCQLLYVSNPKDPAAPVRETERRDKLVRFARVLRVRVRAKTMWGKRCLVKLEQNALKKHDNFIGTKLRLDEDNIQVSMETLLCNWLDLAPAWVESNISVTRRLEPKLEVFESKAFLGLTTWYLVEEVEVYVKDDAVEETVGTLGLPLGNDFRTVNLKCRNRLTKTYDRWTWMDDGN
jgi:hypothetical protein